MEKTASDIPTRPRPIESVMADFPLLKRSFDGRRIAYLDSAATSQKPEAVIDAVSDFYRERNANIHRGVYPLASEATEAFEGARARIARFVGASPEETIFTRNATEAINLVAYSWGRAFVRPGDVILITKMEHHSNIVPWQILAAERDAELRYVGIDADGRLDMDELQAELERGVRLVACTHISNVLGTINPVEEIVARAHAGGATVLVDGAQAVPHMPIDVDRIGADFYAFTGHKMLGPTGIGVLIGRREILEEMPPFNAGGDMIKSVDYDESTWNDLPFKFEAGTSPIAQVVGLGAAVDYLRELGMEEVRRHKDELVDAAMAELGGIPGLSTFGPPAGDVRGPLISFSVEGVHPHDVAEILGRSGVCVRAGHHCAQPLMRELGVAATTRASFGVYNSMADVDRLVDGLVEAKRVFGA